MRRILSGLTLLALLFVNLFAVDGGESQKEEEEILRGRLLLPVSAVETQKSYVLLIELNIATQWHINSNKPLEEFLIPTEISFTPSPGISFGRVEYIEPELRKFSFSETEMSVYEGRVYAKTTLTIAPNITEAELIIRGLIYYQACNDQSCLAPEERPVTLLVEVAQKGTAVSPANQAVFDSILPHFKAEQDDDFSKVVKESGFFYTLLFIFAGGLALNLTPCVYPLIPITISYFSSQSGSSSGKAGLVVRAAIYVLGMSLTYSVLGVAAALTGGLLGSALQNPIVLIFVALVMVGLALSMFGLYEIRVPQSLAMIGGANRSGYLGTLLMGLTVGLIAAPCIGPFVLGLLTYVSEIGDALIGFWMFFVLAMGLGTPFLFLGIFSGAATHLPQSGAWMVWVRNIFGFILIGMAVYFLEPLFPGKEIYFYLLGIIAVVAGIYLGWIDKNKGKPVFNVVRYIVGAGFIILGVFIVFPTDSAAGPQITWQPYSDQLLSQARETGKPVIIDFYADWCIPCKELDKFTFSDPAVVESADGFVTLKADLTKFESEATEVLRNTYHIIGVPTIVFLTSSGEEMRDKRLAGYEPAEKFLERMRTVLAD